MITSKHFTRLLAVSLLIVGMTTASTQAKAQTWVYITGPTNVACGGQGFYNAFATGTGTVTSYSWFATFSSGGAASGFGSSFLLNFPNASGAATISLTAYIRESNGTFRSTYSTWNTSYGGVAPAMPGTISGPTHICTPNSTSTYSISAVSGASTYTWSVPNPYKIVHPSNGSLVNSYTGTQRSISVRFPSSGSVSAGSSGWIRVRANSGGACPASSSLRNKNVAFGPQYGSISGSSTLGQSGLYTFRLNGSNLTNISWTYPSGISPWGSTTSSILTVEVLGNSGGGYMRAYYKSCGVNRLASKYVTITNSSGDPGIIIPRDVVNETEAVEGVSIYPNPASDVVTITSASYLKSVTLTNVVGQTLRTATDVGGMQATLNVNGLEAGNYFVVAISEAGKQVHQLVVQ